MGPWLLKPVTNAPLGADVCRGRGFRTRRAVRQSADTTLLTWEKPRKLHNTVSTLSPDLSINEKCGFLAMGLCRGDEDKCNLHTELRSDRRGDKSDATSS